MTSIVLAILIITLLIAAIPGVWPWSREWGLAPFMTISAVTLILLLFGIL